MGLAMKYPEIQTPSSLNPYLTYHDKYVIVYNFKTVGKKNRPPQLPMAKPNWIDTHVATKEVTTLTADLEAVGFQTEIRAGYEESLLVFVKAPRNILGTAVYNSR